MKLEQVLQGINATDFFRLVIFLSGGVFRTNYFFAGYRINFLCFLYLFTFFVSRFKIQDSRSLLFAKCKITSGICF